ncbi:MULTISPECIES: CFI-box-CTERM domain-containing protein [unclassified Aeromonas]|jgi:serine/threonine protein kinase|uniref:CFI-box-CTERM domain-containing protein n=1 Tax=unclassified Aeromonas TaxID=257493 RepID=UPI0022E025E3|nr:MULTISPECIES: CFI-box-CTERM domain-containing protein [unclassified Aeromonas]
MSYPTLEQYNEAFQHPHLALTDPELKLGSIATTGLGLPLALCGGFALTYTIKNGTKKHAVRCFHKQSNALEKRYISISSRLKSLRSPYFVDFEFQPQGVRVAGKSFPIVKMAWASGTTLGEFLERNHRSSSNLLNLRASLQSLAKYLESQGMAHGDVQPGNVMVADAGNKVQLIDYDGIFVEELKTLGSSELGHRNFQHPKRASSSWNATLDRFSFISLDLAIRALASHPELWSKTHSDGDSILFKANDFADPSQSSIFSDLVGRGNFAEDAKNFAAICKSAFDKTPTLEDFLAKRNIPQVAITVAKPSQESQEIVAQYLSAFPVLDATNYSLCSGFVGDKVELIGQVIEVNQNKTRHGKPYVFINFGPWQGHIVKISIWSEGLGALTTTPTASWVGKWVSVTGLMEPPYVSRKYNYSHLSISITQGSQLHLISEKEARFRLAGSSTRSANPGARTSNQEILDSIKTGSVSARTTSPFPPTATGRTSTAAPATSNQAVLQRIRSSQPTSQPSSTSRQPRYNQGVQRSQPSSSSSNCFIATAVYGLDAPETNTLRQWRDRALLPHFLGRLLVSAYYAVSPRVVPVISRNKWIRDKVKSALDRIVHAVASRFDGERHQ